MLTPRGEVVDLPQGGTVLDFAYHVHTEVGHRCRGAKVNGRIVPLDFTPASGDRDRDPDQQDRRAAARLAAGIERFPGQRPRARQGARLVPQARSRAQRAGRQGDAGQGVAPGRDAARRPVAGAREVPPGQRRGAAGGAGAGRRRRRARSAARCTTMRRRCCRRKRRRRCRPRAEARAAASARRGAGQPLHRRGRRQPAVATGALLPAGAGRCDRRLPDPRSRRQHPSPQLRQRAAPDRLATGARAAGELGPGRQHRATKSASRFAPTTASGCSRT